uniref:Uncharacterized protein n=2 Tax=Rhodnius prolixus TaxID=13249 RepID=T1HMN1_RHOPR
MPSSQEEVTYASGFSIPENSTPLTKPMLPTESLNSLNEKHLRLLKSNNGGNQEIEKGKIKVVHFGLV